MRWVERSKGKKEGRRNESHHRDSTQKPKIRGKPQIAQVSQMIEAKGFGCDHRKSSSGKKRRWQRPCILFL